jgi:hypothetical protein
MMRDLHLGQRSKRSTQVTFTSEGSRIEDQNGWHYAAPDKWQE